MSREAFEAWYDKNHWSMLSTPKEDVASIWQAAQADAFERAAKVCDVISKERDDEAVRISSTSFDPAHFLSGESSGAEDCAYAIRALAKEAT